MIRALLFVLAVLVPWPALAAEPTVALEIDVSALPDDQVTADLEIWLTEHQTAILRDGGIETSADADNTIRVVVSRYGEGDVHYRATIVLVDRPTEAVELERTITCELCRDTDLANEVGEEVARLSGRLLYAAQSTDGTDEQPEKAPPSEEPPGRAENFPTHRDPTVHPKSRKIGPLGCAGIASIVAGAGALGTGIYLGVRPDDWRLVAGGTEQRTTRPAGIAVLSAGAAVLTTGVVLVVVDAVRRKPQRRVTLSPTVTPIAAAMRMGVRF